MRGSNDSNKASLDRIGIIDRLNSLIQLDLDLIATYDAAIEHLKNPTFKSALLERKQGLLGAIGRLSALVKSYGGTPKIHSNMQTIFTKSRVIVGVLINDRGILRAMEVNEKERNARYISALKSLADVPELRWALSAALAVDEVAYERLRAADRQQSLRVGA